ncbi:hypothetical protein HCN44_001109 [Aphidius gifuensis]|uniref:Uncharacterized protein n=1 Tax=Aphidius gifuensis TaxID=684658 RepID=A0A834XM49_APHGI|nr:hypothetical protein HCN44_001109 [Aphidius gifuensis]
MKLLVNLTIFGLFLASLTNQFESKKIYLKSASTKELSWKDKSDHVEINLRPIAENSSSVTNLIKLGSALASITIPPPLGPIIGFTSMTFFTFYDANKKKIEDAKKPIHTKKSKIAFEENITQIKSSIIFESEKTFNNVKFLITTQTGELKTHITSESQRIIKEIFHIVDKHGLLLTLGTTSEYLDNYYEDNHVDCLLKNKCSHGNKESIFKQLTDEGTDYKINLRKFLSSYRTDTIIGPVTNCFGYILAEHALHVDHGCDCNIENGQFKILKLFLSMMLTLSKSYSMMITAIMLQECDKIDKKNGVTESHLITAIKTVENFNKEALNMTEYALIAMGQASTEVRRCDLGREHKKGITYDHFNQIYGNYIVFDYNRLKIFSQILPQTDEVKKWRSTFPKEINLSNVIYGFNGQNWTLNKNCQYDRTIAEITHYYEENNTERFYHHVKIFYKNDFTKIYGKTESDKKLIIKSFKNHPRFRSKYCMLCPSPVRICTVNSTTNSVRFVSIKPVIASTDYVVTGVRWKFLNKILYLEIQQGKFENDTIVDGTVEWKKTNQHASNTNTISIGKNSAKGFIMDDVKLPLDYIITGVKFNVSDESTITLFVTGKDMYSNDTQEVGPISYDNTWDQDVIPFIDIRDIVTSLPAPISGIKAYSKNVDGLDFVGIDTVTNTELDFHYLEFDESILDDITEMYDQLNEVSKKFKTNKNN